MIGKRPIVVALTQILREMDDGTPILREWRHNIEVAVKVIRGDTVDIRRGCNVNQAVEVVGELVTIFALNPTPKRREELLKTVVAVLDYFYPQQPTALGALMSGSEQGRAILRATFRAGAQWALYETEHTPDYGETEEAVDAYLTECEAGLGRQMGQQTPTP